MSSSQTAGRSPSGARRRGPRRGDVAEHAILDTAERLLAERPLNAIPIAELAAGAGISRPTFYFYFESREAVLRELALRITEQLYHAAERWLRRGDEPPAEGVRSALAESLALWRQHGPVLRAIVRAHESDQELHSFWQGLVGQLVEAAARQIERERRAGIALPGPPSARSLASALVGMCDRAWYEASAEPGSARADRELTDTLAAVWLRSVYGTSAPSAE
jgi:AcrR family transcriptional regulator